MVPDGLGAHTGLYHWESGPGAAFAEWVTRAEIAHRWGREARHRHGLVPKAVSAQILYRKNALK